MIGNFFGPRRTFFQCGVREQIYIICMCVSAVSVLLFLSYAVPIGGGSHLMWLQAVPFIFLLLALNESE